VNGRFKPTRGGSDRFAAVWYFGLEVVYPGGIKKYKWLQITMTGQGFELTRVKIVGLGMRKSTIDVHTIRESTATRIPLTFEVRIGELLSQRQAFSLKPSSSLTDTSPVSLDLKKLGFKQFEDDVSVIVLIRYNDTVIASESLWVPLPTLFVPGIDPLAPFGTTKVPGSILQTEFIRWICGDNVFCGNGTWPVAEQVFKENNRTKYRSDIATNVGGQFLFERLVDPNALGNTRTPLEVHHPYRIPDKGPLEPVYPVMQTVSFRGTGSDRNSSSLASGASVVRAYIDNLIRNSYAKRVNLVAHSKGTLYVRHLLSNNRDYAHKWRNVALVQGPHAGSALAEFLDSVAVPSYGKIYPDGRIFRNLLPVWNPYLETKVRPSRLSSTKNSTSTMVPAEVIIRQGHEWRKEKELRALNEMELPRSNRLRYVILFSKSVDTLSGLRMDKYVDFNNKVVGAQMTPIFYGGDGIVPAFSQKGSTIDLRTGKTSVLPAFRSLVGTSSLSYFEIHGSGTDHSEAFASKDVISSIWRLLHG